MKIELTGIYWTEQAVPPQGTVVEAREADNGLGWWFDWGHIGNWWASNNMDDGWGARVIPEPSERLSPGETGEYLCQLIDLQEYYDSSMTRADVVRALRKLASEIETGTMEEREE